MNINDITVGAIYHDGKSGVREVLAKEEQPIKVRYRLLAAKQEREWSHQLKSDVSVIGRKETCTLQSFAAWAKIRLDPAAGAQLVVDLQARKIKLSPGELAFMEAARSKCYGKTGDLIPISHMEGRAVSGLEKKGMVVRRADGAEVTQHGAAWFRQKSENSLQSPAEID